ncbi:unnamed protein product [Meloidogyne enterolobii]|uniref:Uncharacterized protein n=1 Tax=Meloidogyne enterolobii TaxID=390850 RepID=A0ACB1AFC1_MELEN
MFYCIFLCNNSFLNPPVGLFSVMFMSVIFIFLIKSVQIGSEIFFIFQKSTQKSNAF